MGKADKIERLEKQKEQLAARIQQEKAKLAEEKKRRDTRRKILIGGVMTKLLREGVPVTVETEEQLRSLVLKHVTRASDRKLFEELLDR